MTTELGFDLPDCTTIDFESVPTLFYRDNFESFDKFFKDYEKGIIPNESGSYVTQSVLSQLQTTERNGQNNLKPSTLICEIRYEGDSTWYGLRSRMKQQTWRFLYERTEFVYRDYYDNLRTKIWDSLQKLLRNQSIAEIIKKNFEWNDKELGLFSFDRASLSLTPKYAYYSFDTKKTYQEDLVKTIGDGEKTKYFLKSDNTELNLCYEVILNEPNEFGETKIYIDSKKQITTEQLEEINKIGYLSVVSDIKNSFIYQVPKPKIANAIRLFVDFGCNCDVEWDKKIYCGLTGILIAEFFEYLGFATSIVPYIGYKRYSKKQGKEVYRLLAYQAKKFSEGLETEKLLLSCSDIAFFRTRFFFYAHLISDFYGDEVYENIGSNMDRKQKQCSIIQKFKEKDKNLDTFYFNIADIESEKQALELITYLIFNVDNENKKLRNEVLGLNEKILTEDELKKLTNDALKNSNNP
jgi:hypothetical protein